MLIPDAIITEARSWLGTRFHHQGRVKATATHKGGVDCIGLVLGVADALHIKTKDGSGKLLSHFDEKGYHRLPDGHYLQAVLERHLHPLLVEDAKPGDILLFSFDKNPQHVGIRSEVGIIHCYAEARKVVEHRLDAVWQKRAVAAYRFEGVNSTHLGEAVIFG